MSGNLPRLERIAEIVARTGMSRATIYQRMKAGTFPQSVPIGDNSVAWVSSEIDAWIAERVANRDSARIHKEIEAPTSR
jgi:prophage regulatory protein